MSSPPPPDTASGSIATVGPRPGDPRSWGLGDVWAIFVLANLVVGIVVSLALASGGYDSTDDMPFWMFGVVNAPLPLALAGLSVWAVTVKGRGPVADLGLEFRGEDVGRGFLTGVVAQLLVVPALTYPFVWLFDVDTEEISETARELADRATNPAGVVTLIVTVCILAPLCEEIFFRGLLMQSYRKRRNLPWLAAMIPARRRPDVDGRRWNLVISIVLSSALFGIVHFQDPILWPALAGAGAIFAWLAHRSGRLGPAIWAHFGFNFTTVVALLAFGDDEAAVTGVLSLLVS